MNDPIKSTKEDSSPLPISSSNETIAPLNEITKILVAISILLIIGVSAMQLDFLDGTLLGLEVVGFNFYLTRQSLLKVFFSEGLKIRVLILYVLKLGLSAIVLYFAIVQFELSRIGLLIGLSSIVITIFVFSIKQALFSSSNAP